VTPTGFKPVTF